MVTIKWSPSVNAVTLFFFLGYMYSVAQIPTLRAVSMLKKLKRFWPIMEKSDNFYWNRNGFVSLFQYLQVWIYFIFHLGRLMWNNRKAVTRIKISLEKKSVLFIKFPPSNQIKAERFLLISKTEKVDRAQRNNLVEKSFSRDFTSINKRDKRY